MADTRTDEPNNDVVLRAILPSKDRTFRDKLHQHVKDWLSDEHNQCHNHIV